MRVLATLLSLSDTHLPCPFTFTNFFVEKLLDLITIHNEKTYQSEGGVVSRLKYETRFNDLICDFDPRCCSQMVPKDCLLYFEECPERLSPMSAVMIENIQHEKFYFNHFMNIIL